VIENNNTALALIENAFKAYSDRPAFTCLGTTLTYRQIDEKSAAFSRYLVHELGLVPGDRIALQMPNVTQYPIALYGALRAGLVVVNVNPLYTQRELLHQLKDSGAKALVVLANVASEVAKIVDQTDVKSVLVTEIGDFMPWPKALLVNVVVKYIKKLVPPFKFRKSINFNDALCKGARLPPFEVVVGPQDLMILQYTGGTTGVSKGAMLSQFNLYANVRQIQTHFPEFFSHDREIFAAPLPLYHIYALNLHLMSSFSNGAQTILIPNPRDLESLFDALKPHKLTVFVGINTLFNAMLHHKRFFEIDFSALKVTAAGGMALITDTAKEWEKRTNTKVCEGYGLTETSPVVTGNQLKATQLGSIGRPVPDTEVKVINETGESLPFGEAGELCIRGPQVMLGYWQKPEATAEVIDAEGWFKSGDIAVIQSDGFIKIVDRKKDMIIVSGFNVYPSEIEEVAMQHPDILEAAVVGVPQQGGGEVVKIFVVPENDRLTEEDVIEHCRANLTRYKVPKLVEFRTTLPKSNVGKILRKDLRVQN
jgi:long-chain acyl-CoA synthetase